MTLQKKSLTHILKLLDSIDNYAITKSIRRVAEENELPDKTISKIMDAYQTAFSIENQKIRESKEWISVLLTDLN
jgi:hypothetical protein